MKLPYHSYNLAQADFRKALAQELYDKAHLKGQFTLRSGRVATDYFDKYAVFADPQLLYKLTKEMAALVPPTVQIIAGREMGTIATAVLLSQHTGIECAFIRSEPKRYGTQKVVEGPNIRGKNVLVLENIATSGGEVMTTTLKLRTQGALVTHALVILDQDAGARERTKLSGVELLSVLQKTDFDRVLQY